MEKKRLIVGISGASGIPIALELLKALHSTNIESHLIITQSGKLTIKDETDLSFGQICGMADFYHENSDLSAGPASGTWKCAGMIVVPCSMKTLAGICSGYSDNLLLRAADVMLKERRKLVLVTRESPLSAIHLRNMLELSEMGATILPPMLSYYNHPQTLEEATQHIVGKVLDQFEIDYPPFMRWQG